MMKNLMRTKIANLWHIQPSHYENELGPDAVHTVHTFMLDGEEGVLVYKIGGSYFRDPWRIDTRYGQTSDVGWLYGRWGEHLLGMRGAP